MFTITTMNNPSFTTCRSLLLFLLCSLCHALTSMIEEFDFVIVGGGTAGLTVANRLSELPNITVAIIEAGDSVFNNPAVTDPDDFTVPLGTSIDWQYQSTSQPFAAGQQIEYHSGKALGGTSTINGMTYVRAEKAQIDSWGAIGNQGWSWDELFPYYKKSENFTIPNAKVLAAGGSYIPGYHGDSGPLKVGYYNDLLDGDFPGTVKTTWQNIGIPHNQDVNGGHVRGFTVWPSTLDRDANVREDAARAYYYPIQNRPNLYIFLNTTVSKILWKNSTEEVEADGVEMVSSTGEVISLKANREVILSAGSLRSPAILELSGIGNPSILDQNGIALMVDLPSVGENLQDQPNTGFVFSSNTTFNGTIPYVTYGAASDFLQSLPGKPSLESWAKNVSAAVNNSVSAASLEYLFNIQYDLIQNGIPDAETIIGTTMSFGLGPSDYLFSALWLLMPFSRGHVHIRSPDPSVYPDINPNFFLVDFDLDVQIGIAKWTRKFWSTEPARSLATEISPGFDTLPANATDLQWGQWIKSSFTSNSHPLGSAAMMPKELGGVVDSSLKVYGTSNVRVVDASVMPFQVSGHLTSTIYAIAEKASDMIKESISEVGVS